MDKTLTSPQVCRIADCSYRELDYWCRIGAVRSHVAANGSGSRRVWTRRQAACVWVVARLAEMGCPTWTTGLAFDALERDDRAWAGPLLVTPGRGGGVRPVTGPDDLAQGWVVDPRPALAACAERAETLAAA